MPKPSKPGVVGEPFDEAKIRDALIRTRPLTIGPDRPVEQAVVCQAFNGDSLVAEYFGFRNVESYGGYRVTCSEISNDGSLKPHA